MAFSRMCTGAVGNIGSSGAKVKGTNVRAAGKFLDLLHDALPVMEEFVPDHRMGCHDDELVAGVDLSGVGILRVGGTDNFRPMFTNGVLRGFAANLVLDHQVFDERREVARGTFPHAAGSLVGNAAEVGDEFLGEAAELVRFFRHAVEGSTAGEASGAHVRKGCCSGRAC